MAYEDDNSSLDLTKFKEENATKNETSKSTVNKNKAQSLVFIPTHIENHTNMAGEKKWLTRMTNSHSKLCLRRISRQNSHSSFRLLCSTALKMVAKVFL